MIDFVHVADAVAESVDAHTVQSCPTQTQLFVGLHLIHEVTTPQAFDMLRARGWQVRFPDRTIATVDHIVPTRDQRRPFLDVMAEDMFAALERNCRDAGVRLFDMSTGSQGIVHVIGPEMGLTQPGMTIACGDSHTSTHGALGAVAFGIGTSQVRDVLASQCPRWIRSACGASGCAKIGARRLREGCHPRDHLAGWA
jgi:3-isopropylmalate/(R)-2-methylmalate dehydratase large subunit